MNKIIRKIRNKIIYSSFKIYDNYFYSENGLFKFKKIIKESKRKISVVITYYNRHKTIHKALYHILNDERVGEIIIVDDHSDEKSFSCLKKLVKKIDNKKIKVFRNEINLGMYKNKIYSISKSSNEWTILLDSDNTITENYLEAIFSKEEWDEDIMYCPSFAWPLINNESLANKKYNIRDIKNLLTHDPEKIKGFLNLGNFFVNKKKFTDIMKDYIDCTPFAADSIFINYIWLSKGKCLYLPKNCKYIHRINPDSTWMIQNERSIIKYENIIKAILMLENNPKKVI